MIEHREFPELIHLLENYAWSSQNYNEDREFSKYKTEQTFSQIIDDVYSSTLHLDKGDLATDEAKLAKNIASRPKDRQLAILMAIEDGLGRSSSKPKNGNVF